MANQNAIENLLINLKSPERARAWAACDRLRELSESVPAAVLRGLIEDSPWGFVIDAAAYRLATVANGNLLETLFLALERLWGGDEDFYSTLKSIGEAFADSGNSGLAYLLNELKGPNPIRREIAVLLLSFFEPTVSLESVLRVLRSSDGSGVRAMAINSLAHIDSLLASNAILEACSDSDPNVRGNAVLHARPCADPRVRSAIRNALNNENEFVRWAATQRQKERGCGDADV